MMSAIGDDPVMWVNVVTLVPGKSPWANSNMQLWNDALTEAAANYPNLRVYDWASVAGSSWFDADRIHYTKDGYARRAALIADALAAAFPG